MSYPRHLPDSMVGAWTAAAATATNGSPQLTVVMVLVVEVVLVSCVQNFRDGPPRMDSTAALAYRYSTDRPPPPVRVRLFKEAHECTCSKYLP